MFKDKMDIKEKVTVGILGPKVQSEKVVQEFATPIKHANGCGGHIGVYFDITSVEIRAKCYECGSAYTLARTEDGFFKRG